MKRTLFAMLSAITFLVTSCSKEAKLNRRIDGIWHVISRNHKVILSEGKMEFITFDKEKNNKGNYSWFYSDSTGMFVETGTYELKNDELITLTSKGFVNPLTVTHYSKTDLTLTNGVGDIIEAKSRESL